MNALRISRTGGPLVIGLLVTGPSALGQLVRTYSLTGKWKVCHRTFCHYTRTRALCTVTTIHFVLFKVDNRLYGYIIIYIRIIKGLILRNKKVKLGHLSMTLYSESSTIMYITHK